MQGKAHVHVKVEPGLTTRFVDRDAEGCYLQVGDYRYRHPALDTLEAHAVQTIVSRGGKVVVRDLFSQVCVIEPNNPPLLAKLTAGSIEHCPRQGKAKRLLSSVKQAVAVISKVRGGCHE